MRTPIDIERGENAPAVDALPTRKPWAPPRVIEGEVEVDTESMLDDFGPHGIMAS